MKMNISYISPEEFIQSEDDVLKELKIDENLNKIPFINHVNVQNLKDNTLVRFRGMIQDMLDPEYYLEKYAVVSKQNPRIQNGRFRDTFLLANDENVDFDNSQNAYGERRSIFVVTIPGINKWVEDAERETDEDQIVASIQETPSQSVKRPLEDSDDVEAQRNIPMRATAATTSNQRVQESSAGILSREYLLNSPISDRPSRACLIKIYNDFDNLTLNSIVDVIGFLSVDPVLDGTNHEVSEFDDINEIQSTNPPPSLIPRIHAISIEQINHFNPLVSRRLPEFDEQTSLELFKDIHLVLTQCLFGDAITAEYLMAHLISTVYVRSELECLGQFSLNISNLPMDSTYTKMLYEIMEMILPASHFFPMTLDNLNSSQFSPKKDYTCNKLVSGVLQLAAHTHLVLDETQLQVGQLQSNGVNAVSSIAHLINNQQIKCDFQFYNIELNVDIPVLVLSEGKSMLPSNCHVPLMTEVGNIDSIKETIDAVKVYIQPKLNLIRKYLTTMRLIRFNMNSDELTTIENDFVEMRRESRETTVDDLHCLIVLSRLISLCRGKSTLQSDLWTHAKHLENERKKRILSMHTRRNC